MLSLQMLGAVETKTFIQLTVVSEIFCQKLLKSANLYLSYNRQCPGRFFRFSVYFNTYFA